MTRCVKAYTYYQLLKDDFLIQTTISPKYTEPLKFSKKPNQYQNKALKLKGLSGQTPYNNSLL